MSKKKKNRIKKFQDVVEATDVEPLDSINGAVMKENPEDEPEKIMASKEDYLAVQLHQARVDCNDLRKLLKRLRKALLEKDKIISNLHEKLIELEIQAAEKENESLRSTYALEMGKTIKRDDATGEVWWI